ncbi:hypothetical protein [Pectobacterium cacticida]
MLREGISMARYTVARLMAVMGLAGVPGQEVLGHHQPERHCRP